MTIASPLDKKAISISTLPSPSTFLPPISLPSAPPVTSTSVPVVPSLFSSVYQAPTTTNQQQQLLISNSQLNESNSLAKMSTNLTASAPTMIGNQTSVSISSFTPAISTNLTAVAAAPAMTNNQTSTSSSSFTFTATSSVSSLSQPFLPTSTLLTTSSTIAPTLPPSQPMQNLGFQSRLPTTSTVGNLSSLSLSTQLSGQTLSSSSLPSTMTQSLTSSGMQPQGQQLSSLGLGNLNTTTASTLSATLSSSGTLSAATSPVGGGPNTNPLIQLVQMYKHFQSQGDSQGMMRVRQQLNILVARQKIINAQNSLRAVSALSSAQSSTANLPAASSLNASTMVQNVNTRPTQSQNPTNSSVGLGQIPQVLQQSGQSAQQQQQAQPQGGALPNFSTASSTLPARPSVPKPPQMPVTVSQVPPSMLSASHPSSSVAIGSSTLPQANAMPSGMSIAGVSTTVSQTPFNTPSTSALATKTPTTTTTTNISQQQPSVGAIASQSLQQQIIKRLQTVIASLPESQRPKTIPELKDFVQKYSSLITQNSLFDLSVPGTAGSQMAKSTVTTTAGLASTSTPRQGPSSVASGTRLSQSGSIPSLLNSTAPMANSGAKLSLPPPPSATGSVAPPPPPAPASVTVTSAQINSVTTQSPSAQVAEHFKSSLAGLAVSKAPLGPTVGAAVSSVLASSVNSNPLSISLMVPGRVGMSVPSTVHAPVTTQFAQKVGTVNSALPTVNQTSKPSATVVMATTSQAPPIAPPTSTPNTATSTSGGSGIQPGVATPLPPGLTLETLSVLCRLPETDLLKLKLPPALLSAIKVWKARQPPSKSAARVSSIL